MRPLPVGIAVLVMGLSLAVAATDGTTDLVSMSAAGVGGNSHSTSAAVAADGSAVAFQSQAYNLHPEDTDVEWDVYVADLETGELYLASIRADDKKRGRGGRGKSLKGNGESLHPSLSADGRWVAFDSRADNLDRADPNVRADIYVKDLVTGGLTLASTSPDGVVGDGYSIRPSLSGDGRLVAFQSVAANLHPVDLDTTTDVFVKDLVTGEVRLASAVSTARGLVKGNAASYGAALSGDGTAVAFTSIATNLHPADTDPDADVYHKDLVTGALTLVSAAGDRSGTRHSYAPAISADGRFVAFLSDAADLSPEDPDTVTDAYLKDVSTGELRLVSTTADGVKADNRISGISLSGNGGVVAYSTRAQNLSSDDTDIYISDVYTKAVATGILTLSSVNSAGVKGDDSSFDPSLSHDGFVLAFTSYARNLHPADAIGTADVYARH